ncbi:FRG domain-containing protein [Pantoea sp. 18069]|uniref:FRG domain-containing protein n=1 Tax=Pantoea sp. 18069 TaxID=2681415 RepID=UPI00135B836A|nr:FRG domain-containing protein [Pantoea sp. 18069]
MNRDNVFLEVFSHVKFPKLAVDLERLEQAADKGSRTGSHLSFPLSAPSAKRSALLAAWRGLLRQVDVTSAEIAMVGSMLSSNRARKQILSLVGTKGKFAIAEQGDLLYWGEDTPWPAAYSSLVSQLVAIVGVHGNSISQLVPGREEAVNRAGFDASFMRIVSEYPRQMPTEIQYAMASLGAWLGGAANIQYLSYYATIRQITHKSLNVTYAKRMNYSQQDADVLHGGGLALVPMNLYADVALAQGDPTVFGSIPIDELNGANLPSEDVMRELPITDPISKFPGLMLDKHYRAAFWARKLGKQALFGARNVLRDHYTDFYNSLPIESLVRCKHYCAPVVRVHGMDELRSLSANIPIRSEGGVFFRGQGKLHLLARGADVQRMLFGDSCAREPSLVTAASRDTDYAYDDVHFALRLFLEQKVALQDRIMGKSRLNDWQEMVRSPQCRLDRAIMALAQHYGLPTHGLDITRNPDVAAWFATNRYSKSNVMARYEVMAPDTWPSSEEDWPVVVACQAVTHSTQGSLHDCEDLDQFGFGSMRPAAQSALFFQGGHSDHVNRLAETVVCIFRLAPAVYETGLTFKALFPAPEEDAAYRVMLEFASSAQFGSLWGRYVNRFHEIAP